VCTESIVSCCCFGRQQTDTISLSLLFQQEVPYHGREVCFRFVLFVACLNLALNTELKLTIPIVSYDTQHAYHVVISVNKLVDLMVLSGQNTFGLRADALSLLALTLAALIHDVEHQGIPK